MKKSGRVFLILLLALLLLPCTGAFATTDGTYVLNKNLAASWDGTTGNRLDPATADFDYAYGDESTVTYTLPWQFTFYGQAYSQITADTNGNVWLGSTGSANSFNLAANGKGPVIAAWNNDLSSYFTGGYLFSTSPTRSGSSSNGRRKPIPMKALLFRATSKWSCSQMATSASITIRSASPMPRITEAASQTTTPSITFP